MPWRVFKKTFDIQVYFILNNYESFTQSHMKASKTPHATRLARMSSASLMAICCAMAMTGEEARAVSVDNEMLILIDATQNGLTVNQFDRLMDSYSTAFTSSTVLDSIQSGAYGRIAVSMAFFGNSNSYSVGIPWMLIENATQAQDFANLIQSVIRPSFTGASNVAAALTSAAFTFGTETGGASNGFESEVQMIEVVASRVPTASAAAATSAASNIVRAAGVDQINSIAVGNATTTAAIDAFYSANVIGSTIPDAPATSSTSTLNAAALNANITNSVNNSVQTGATTSMITAVPEPSSALALAAGVILFLKRRRR